MPSGIISFHPPLPSVSANHRFTADSTSWTVDTVASPHPLPVPLQTSKTVPHKPVEGNAHRASLTNRLPEMSKFGAVHRPESEASHPVCAKWLVSVPSVT